MTNLLLTLTGFGLLLIGVGAFLSDTVFESSADAFQRIGAFLFSVCGLIFLVGIFINA